VTTVAVKSEVLKWAIDRSNRSVADLSRRFPKIKEWIRGTSQPTLHQLEELSKATTTPLGQLFLDAPPDQRLSIPHYRTISGGVVRKPSVDLLDTIYMIEMRQAWAREFLIEEGYSRVPLVKSARLDEPIITVAQRMRQAIKFDEAWASRQDTWESALRALRVAMEDAGIFVSISGVVGSNNARPLDPDEFRGFVLVDDYAPFVFVNGADARAAQMFTLAHELAHICFGSSAIFDLGQMLPANDAMERACNSVAAEFLVPEALLRVAWTRIAPEHSNPIPQLAKRFRVSEIVAARRALDLGLINKETFIKLYLRLQGRRAARPQSSGGDFYQTAAVRLGVRFANTVIHAYRERKLLPTDAYALTGLHGQTFDKFASGIV
jgi:Zn-dependent peptidase ImmA (M78 family)